MRRTRNQLLLIFLLPILVACVDHNTDSEIKVGDSFAKLRTNIGFPSNVTKFNGEEGRFETIYIDNHQKAYVFNSDFGSAMDLQSSEDFVICKIIDFPKEPTAYACD